MIQVSKVLRRRYWLGAVIGVMFSAAITSINVAADTDGLDKGTFLLATKRLNQSGFKQAVVLVTGYGRGGAVGVIINRPSKMTLGHAFPHFEHFKHVQNRIFIGGPVMPNGLFVLLGSREPVKGWKQISKGLYFSPLRQPLAPRWAERLLEDSARLYVGYSGWAAGQLESEIRRGDWRVVNEDPEIVFSTEVESLWSDLSESWSGKWI